jgi:hypothetical protein
MIDKPNGSFHNYRHGKGVFHMTDDQVIRERDQEPKETTFDPARFHLAEYGALRAEILKKTDIQHQLLSLSLIALGTFITIGFESSATLLLVYPILAMFLAASWSHHDIRIAQLGDFIRSHHETKFFGEQGGWEQYHPSSDAGKAVGSRISLASRGILIGSQILAVTLGLLKTTFLTHDLVVIGLDAVLIPYTVFLLNWKS